jgi:serine/threonine protein kinase
VNNVSSAEVVFFAALEQGTPEGRVAYLGEACVGNEALRRRVEALLAAHSNVGRFLERPVVEAERVASLGGGDSAEADLSFLAPPSEPGSLGRLDHYEVLEVVGRGGTGLVLRARDTKLERIVAIKVLAAPLAASGTACQRFAREARAAAAVRDEHVVAIHAVRDDAPLPYLVMEFIDGCNLEALLRKGGPPGVKEVLRIGLQVAGGLAAAHRLGLVHRDVKPANILLENGVQRVKLTDFGLARAADDASLTQTGFIAGTPLYMAPEQANGEAIDCRADLFSLGSVLYELCAGRPAFRAPTTVAVIRRVCDDAPRPLREVNPDIPEPLCRLIDRLHAKNPADRPASAQEVADLLAGLLADLQHPGASVGVPASAGWERHPAEAGTPTRKRARQPWAWAAASLLMLLAGLGASEATGVIDVRGTATRLLNGRQVVRISEEAAPLTEAERWEQSVAALPAERQVAAVVSRLKELNPGFDGQVTPIIENGVVIALKFCTDEVADISPVRALKALRGLECGGTRDNQGRLTDLSPLRGLPLGYLQCPHSCVADLTPLKGMPLRVLQFQNTLVSDLTPLEGMPLAHLICSDTRVSDLSPLQGMALRSLEVERLPVSDLSPLRGMPLAWLNLCGM